MAVIIMWRRGELKCQMVISDKGISLRLVDGTSVIREEAVAPRCAASLAERWELEEGYNAWHHSTLAVFA